MENKIRVLIVDDSVFVRTILSDMLSSDREIDIIATAKDGIEAFELAKELKPNVVTMDLVMPRADGIQALQNIKEFDNDISVLMLSASDRASAEAIIRSLELGAFDFILKPASSSSTEILRLKWEIITKIKAAFRSSSKGIFAREDMEEILGKQPPKYPHEISDKIIAIGSSTGGPVALRHILKQMPADLNVPIVIAQHMPKTFTGTFADRLNKTCNIPVLEATDGEILKKGCAYISPGNCHMEIAQEKRNLRVQLTEGLRVKGGRPSVDMLFKSIADVAGKNSIGVLLTGMGSDGARGLKQIKQVGGFTIAQDEHSSLIWGMPHAAIRLEAVDRVISLEEIPEVLLYLLEEAS